MKYCQTCGTALLDAAVTCPNCGATVGAPQTHAQAYAQPTPVPQTPYAAAPAPEKKQDKVSIGFCILAFFIPLFGIIYWIAVHKDTPKRGRACGITGIASWVLRFVMTFFLLILVAIFSDASYYDCETCYDHGILECKECYGMGKNKDESDCPYCVEGWRECPDCDYWD